MDIIKKITVYGDSILKGVIFDDISNRYQLNKENVIEKIQGLFPIDIKNHSKFGCTIGKGYEQIKRAIEKGHRCDVMLLEYGGNDCDYDWEKIASDPDNHHLPYTTIDVFEQTYKKIIAELNSMGIRPLMMSLPPIDSQKYFNWITRKGLNKENILKFLGDVQMIYHFQELYSSTITRIANETKTLYIDIRSKFLDKRNFNNLICIDGIHPNIEGHKIINQAFVDFCKVHSSKIDSFGGRIQTC